MFPNRRWYRLAVIILGNLILALSALGFFTLLNTPALFTEVDGWLMLTGPEVRRIGPHPLTPTMRLHLPEFFTAFAEAEWWQEQETLYDVVRAQTAVSVSLSSPHEALRTTLAQVKSLPLTEVLRCTWLMYFTAALCLGGAASVFWQHHSVSGVVLCFFLLACALYSVCLAPVVCRPLTLPPVVFKILVTTLYGAAGGFITLVHLAFVFPQPKPLLTRYPWLPRVLYSYWGVTLLLYLSGNLAFGATFPTFCLWILVMIGTFLHSFMQEPDAFVRRQIRLMLLAPVLASAVLILAFILPGVLRQPPLDFRYFPLLFLILLFALPLALEHLSLYERQLATERKAQQEKERLRADLHDLMLNNLAVIARASEATLTQVGRDEETVRRRVRTIQQLATDTASDLRQFLWVLEDQHRTWEAVCGHLVSWGQELAETAGFHFTFTASPAVLRLPPPPLPICVCLDRVVREALLNVVKHARAAHVQLTVSCTTTTVCCEVRDDGLGIPLTAPADGQYGVENMRRRVVVLGGVLTLTPHLEQGTLLTLTLPFP